MKLITRLFYRYFETLLIPFRDDWILLRFYDFSRGLSFKGYFIDESQENFQNVVLTTRIFIHNMRCG